jgi:hypothetical protein
VPRLLSAKIPLSSPKAKTLFGDIENYLHFCGGWARKKSAALAGSLESLLRVMIFMEFLSSSSVAEDLSVTMTDSPAFCERIDVNRP